LELNGQSVPKYVRHAGKLSRYAAVTRYPLLAAAVTQRDYRRAVRIAAAVLRWAERQVSAGVKKSGGKR